MKKVLVTGAGGFIGGNLCNELVNRGFSVYGTYRNSKIKNPAVTPIRCDLSKPVDIDGDFDTIIHGAAAIRSGNPNIFIDDCILATRNLIRYAEERNVKKFIFLSSISFHGNVEGEIDTYSDIINPSEYGVSKLLCEKMLFASSIECKYNVRLPRMLGKNIDFSYPWLPALSYKLLKGEDVTYFNPELLYNNMAHVTDLAAFAEALVKREAKEAKTVILGAKDKRKVLDIINILKNGLNSKSKLREIPSSTRNTCHSIDISAAVLLGYSPMSVEDTLARYCEDIKL